MAVIMTAWSLGPSLSLAADFYAHAVQADDSGDGLTPGTAERNISAAIADAVAAGAGPFL